MNGALPGCARRLTFSLSVAMLAATSGSAEPSKAATEAKEAHASVAEDAPERDAAPAAVNAAAPLPDAGHAPPGASPEEVLALARERLSAGDLEAAAAMLRALRRQGGLDPDALARAWLLEGMAVALLDEGEDGARRAFAVALRIQPDLDPGVKQPGIREPFDAAKASLPPPREALFASASARTASGGLEAGVRVELVADDVGLVAAVEDGRARAPLSADAPLAFVRLPHGTAAPAQVALLDADGNTLRRVEVVTAAPAAAAPAARAPDEEDDGWLGRFKSPRWAVADWPWFTLAGVGVGGTGLLMAVGAGAFVALYDRGLLLPDSVDPVFKPALFGGLGVGVLVMLAGGGIIAADQIIRGELYKASSDDDDHAAPAPAEADGAAQTGVRRGFGAWLEE